MHFPKPLTLPSLLLLLLTTTALALPQQPQPRDPCGPKTQSPSDPKDTCTSTPPLVTEPAAFGIFPFSSPTTNNTTTEPTNNNNKNNNNKNTTHPACHLAADKLCTTLAEPGIRAGQWYFETAVSPETAVEGRQACQVGFWPPGEEGAVQGLVEGQCERVFAALVSEVKEGAGEGASVNLVRGPVGVEGMWRVGGEKGEGEGFTGEAVNSGYPSYIVTTYGSAIPAGKCLDPEGRLCDCDGEDGAKCAPLPQCRYQNGNLCECGDDGVTCRVEDGGSAGDVSCLDEDGSGTLVPCPE